MDKWATYTEQEKQTLQNSWQPTSRLRWTQEINSATVAEEWIYEDIKTTLQQEWFNPYTGECKWRNVPMEEEIT